MNRLELKTARSALKDFYGASTECEWAEDTLSGTRTPRKRTVDVEASRKRSAAETHLQHVSPVAYGVYEVVTDFVVKAVGIAGCTDTKAYYLKHREYVADQVFNALEKTLKD
jgi:hypothetical protein